MDRTNNIIILFSTIFFVLFFLSVFMPDTRHPYQEKSKGTELIAQEDIPIDNPVERKIREEQLKYYKSRAEDEADYYRQVAPHDVDDPSFFQRSHPLQEGTLREAPLQESPLPENRLQEKPLPEKPIR